MQIVEYNATEAALAKLTEQYSLVVYDVTTTAGMTGAKVARAEIKGYRTALEAKRKELKAPSLERTRLIDAEAARIKAELLLLENPIDEQIKIEETRKEVDKAAKAAANNARIAQAISNIEQIRAVCHRAAAWNSDETARVMTNLEGVAVGEAEYQEFAPMAVDAKTTALAQLADIYASKLTQEIEAARVELEKAAAAEQEEADRLERNRLADIETAQLAEDLAKLKVEREEFTRKQEEAQAALDERERVARETGDAAIAVREIAEAEQQREKQVLADAEAEKMKKEAAVAEGKRIKAEEAKKAADKALKLANAKCADAETALQKILAICNDPNIGEGEAVDQIALICEATL